MPFPRAFILACSAALLTAVPAFASLQPQAASTPAQPGFRFPSDEEIRDFIRPYVDEGQAKGIVVGLIDPDGRRRIVTYGSAGEGAPPLGPDSVFEIGSINKTFTGAILADMVRRGEVALDDPVSRYLPEGVRVPSRNGRQITLLDLATHMSGLPRLPTGYTPTDLANPYAHFDAEQLHAFLNAHELEREPGVEALYSNLGMGLLGHALARAAGAPSFRDLVEQRILRPLGMTRTAYGRPPALAPSMTRGHDRQGNVVPYWDVAVLAGAGGLNASMADMLAYLEANIGDPATPLEQAMREAQRAHRPGPRPGSGIGLGWMPQQRGGWTLIGHGGGTAGYSTYLGFDPDRRAGVVVLTNSGGFDYADFIGRELLNPERRVAVDLPSDVLDDYVGTYRLRPGFEISVILEDGQLFAEATGQPRFRLYAEARDRFFLRVVDAQLHFTRDAGGAVTSVTLHQNGRAAPGPRVQ